MSRKTTDDGQSLNRRRALASLGAGGAALGGFGVGSAAAKPEPAPEADVSAYESVDVVERVLSEEADVLADLSEEGLISEASADALGIETLGEPATPTDATVDVTAERTANGVTPKIIVQREENEQLVTVGVKPEEGVSFAFLDDGGETQAIGCDCSDDCTCTKNCQFCNNSAKCSYESARGYCVSYTCDCGSGW